MTSIRATWATRSPPRAPLEGVASVLTLQNQTIPPTAGTTGHRPRCQSRRGDRRAPKGLDVDIILSNSFGFGGHNGSVIFRRYVD